MTNLTILIMTHLTSHTTDISGVTLHRVIPNPPSSTLIRRNSNIPVELGLPLTLINLITMINNSQRLRNKPNQHSITSTASSLRLNGNFRNTTPFLRELS